MTVPEIIKELKPKKKLSRAMLYIHLKRAGIKPLGERQIPQQYPQDTPQRLLLRLGLAGDRITLTPQVATAKKSRR